LQLRCRRLYRRRRRHHHHHHHHHHIVTNGCLEFLVGRDSSVGIATRYRLDGPGIESQCGRYFPHPSRPALGPTQHSIQWVPGFSRG
jgi:hypothetical protein